MTCNPMTIAGPRTFWAFQKLACTRSETLCGQDANCSPHDMVKDPDGGLLKKNWLRSFVFMVAGTDRQTEACWDQSVRRRGDPADAFRGTKSGNMLWRGHPGTAQQQLAKHRSDLTNQLTEAFNRVGISASVKVETRFAGVGTSEIIVSIGQEKVSVLSEQKAGRSDLAWSNI